MVQRRKGLGFIKQDEGADVFVHYSQIEVMVVVAFEDEVVEFEIKEGPKGLQAINVQRPTTAIPAAAAS